MHVGRFRWDIEDTGRPVQSSSESFVTVQEAEAAGRIEMEKLISNVAELARTQAGF
jgi:hypothetical protein